MSYLPPDKGIRCPYCHGFVLRRRMERKLECGTCKTVIDLNADGTVFFYRVPPDRERWFGILAVISFLLLMALLTEAALSKKAMQKLTIIGMIFFLAIWLPLRFRLWPPSFYYLSLRYQKLPIMIAFTVTLLLLLIAQLTDFFSTQ